MQSNSVEDANTIRDVLSSVAESVAGGPRIGRATLLSLKLLQQVLTSDVIGGQVVLTVPADPNKPIDIAFATSNLAIKATP